MWSPTDRSRISARAEGEGLTLLSRKRCLHLLLIGQRRATRGARRQRPWLVGSPAQPMKAASIAATMGPPALTTDLRMALPLIPELIVREQRASGDLLPDADLRKPTRS